MSESNSGVDEPLLSKRAKTTDQTDIIKRLRNSASSFPSSDDNFISGNAAGSSFFTPFQQVLKKLVKFNSTLSSVAKSKSKLLSTWHDIDLNSKKYHKFHHLYLAIKIFLSISKEKKQQVDKEVGRFFEDNSDNGGIRFFLLYLWM